VFSGKNFRQIAPLAILTICISACQTGGAETATPITSMKPTETSPALPKNTSPPAAAAGQTTPITGLETYAFPDEIDPAKSYLFYLHGKIIEDQGIPAISPDYGEYEYEAILQRLAGYGFVVISERRAANTDGVAYARRVAGQAQTLLEAGVPAGNITIVGASKGAGIVVYASHYIDNLDMNFVIMAICHPDVVRSFIQDQTWLAGNVLSIYDSVDEYAGSCQELFDYSEGKGISRHDEIVLHVGTGHGILYRPLDEWVLPTVKWAGK
jgi:hypothetical protein